MASDAVLEFDLGEALGAKLRPIAQKISIYFPNRDWEGNLLDGKCVLPDGYTLPNVETYIDMVLDFFLNVNDGYTRLPWYWGGWKDRSGKIVHENTTIVYSYIRDFEKFVDEFDRLKVIIDMFGQQTKQAEVFVVHSGEVTEEIDGNDVVRVFERTWVISYDTEDAQMALAN